MIDDSEPCLHYELMKTNTALMKLILRKASKLSLSKGQPKVLEALTALGEADQTTIAASCDIDNATLGGILERMENKGLIARRMKDGNRRSLFVSLTEEGKKKADEMNRCFKESDAKALSLLNDSERKELSRLLGLVRRAIDEEQ